MRNDDRQPLMRDDSITLRKINIITGNTVRGGETDFSIISTVGKGGGSALCYEACCESDGTHGRLKEFYPVSFSDVKPFSAFERDSKNQLVTVETLKSVTDNFNAARDAFKDAYRTLAKTKNKPYGEVLNNYIPPFELYEGITENQPGTVYVWTRHDRKIKQFDKYLEEVREDINGCAKEPEHHLFNILNAVFTLTKCISALHTANLIHMDIKPSNFGVQLDENGKIDSSNISLYDANTIYSPDSGLAAVAGTDGFAAPEVIRGECGFAADIYSIGATLFNAVIISDGFDGVYEDKYYNDLDNLVSNSKLITSSDNNSNSALHDILVKILKNSLAHNPDKRYKACSIMLEDIIRARALLLPSEAKKFITDLGQDIRLVDVEEYLDKEIGSGAEGAIQRLLFEHPLYAARDGGNIDVLVLGMGTYAQKFIDIAFEISQIENYNIRITAISNNIKADKERYLNARPAFARFFTVDGVSPNGESFGSLRFVSAANSGKSDGFTRENKARNRAIIEKSICNDENIKYSYVFAALGDDELNYEVAEECLHWNELLDNKSIVCFVRYGKSGGLGGAYPVYVNDVIAQSDYYRDLTRMAFNCHLLWNNSLNVDIQRLKGEFSSPYNFNSCFSNVLSIKYKLHSVGIDDMSNPTLAAARFNRECSGNKAVINSLTKYEHRRWIVNYVCRGWDTLSDFNILLTDTKDKRHKLHPCLVRSDKKWALNMPQWKNNNFRKWDTATDEELSSLDELDRMSVTLHRYFKEKAENAGNLSFLQTEINAVRDNLKSYKEALKAFDRFVLCLKEIAEGMKGSTRLYAYFNKLLRDCLKSLPEGFAAETDKTLKIIENSFYPILKSREYIDFKQYDRDLILGIPFILTYSTGIRLCIPFGTEQKGDFNNNILFANVSAPLLINPSVITYVIDADEVYYNNSGFERALRYALNCIKTHKLQSRVNLLFLQSASRQVVSVEFKESVKSISDRIRNIDIIEYDGDERLGILLTDRLRANQRNKKKRFTAMERNNTGASKLMRGFGCYGIVPAYTYSSLKGEFKTDPECEFLKYKDCEDYLRVSDMFDFQEAESVSALPEMLYDYKYFWSLYKSSNPAKQRKEKIWKKLCAVLKDACAENDLILSVGIPKNDNTPLTEKTYFVPAFCRRSVEKILRGMQNISKRLTGDNPTVSYYNSTACAVTLETVPEAHEKIEELFSNPYNLYDASKIRVERVKKCVNIYFDNLMVKNLKKSALTSAMPAPDFSDSLAGLLMDINEKKYIMNYTEYERGGETFISFTFSSPQIKSLMTNEGRILELYVYYKALEQNYFDDAAIGCEVTWNKDNITNEFDIILTKGFKTLIVECKAREQLEQDFYYKLAQLDRQFGINSVPVLVADTLEAPWHDNSVNDMQRSRGNELGIITLSAPDEINETKGGTGIGAALRRIMKSME
ncbi:MAG: DUF1887 family CARF protein [Firmicutes bacterium]|nr:DUF1887 family CARF protein [Bacillota bacterium]